MPRFKLCDVCGKSFKILNHGYRRHCGKECSKEFERKNKMIVGGVGKGWRKGKEYVPRKICQLCETKFYAPPVQIRRGGGKFCSNNCRTKFIGTHANYFAKTSGRRGRGGRRIDLENRYFRSTWEANYARYLNLLVKQGQIKSWSFEPDTFEFVEIKKGSRFYTPDFKVFENDGKIVYHEVKGYMDQKSKTKLKRMSRYYPNIKIHLIEQSQMKEIKNKCSALIVNWESGLR